MMSSASSCTDTSSCLAMALVRRPVIFLQTLAANAEPAGTRALANKPTRPSAGGRGAWPFTAGGGRQLADHRLQADGGDVPQLLFVRQHVGAQRVHDGLHLVLLHLADQGPQAEGNKRTPGYQRLPAQQRRLSPAHHLTARFCTSPFLSSSNLRIILTTCQSKRQLPALKA